MFDRTLHSEEKTVPLFGKGEGEVKKSFKNVEIINGRSLLNIERESY